SWGLTLPFGAFRFRDGKGNRRAKLRSAAWSQWVKMGRRSRNFSSSPGHYSRPKPEPHLAYDPTPAWVTRIPRPTRRPAAPFRVFGVFRGSHSFTHHPGSESDQSRHPPLSTHHLPLVNAIAHRNVPQWP